MNALFTFLDKRSIITAPSTNTEDAVIVIEGKEFSVEPVESVELYSTIVINGCDTGVLDSDCKSQSTSEWMNQCSYLVVFSKDSEVILAIRGLRATGFNAPVNPYGITESPWAFRFGFIITYCRR